MRKYGRIGASYTDDLGRRLEALEFASTNFHWLIFSHNRNDRRGAFSFNRKFTISLWIITFASLSEICRGRLKLSSKVCQSVTVQKANDL